MSVPTARQEGDVDYKGLIDFNKYTMALAAASFLYTLEKFVPMPSALGRYFVLGLLILFLLSTVIGIVIFAASTAALNAGQARQHRLNKLLPMLGVTHAILLCVGLVLLGVMVVRKALTPPSPISDMICRCIPASGDAKR